jgi:hypothetical protein
MRRELLCNTCHGEASGPADPEHRDSARPHEGKAELGCNGRLCERLRESDSEGVYWLFLRAAPDDPDIRELRGVPAEEVALPALCLQERDVTIGQCGGQGNPGRASARSDVDDRPGAGGHDAGRQQRFVDQNAACGNSVA